MGRERAQHAQCQIEALYVTGPSLGAAMAAMAALLLRTDAKHERMFDKLRPVYTYGQPMIGDHRLAKRCDEPDVLRDKLIRYVFGRETAAQLPPSASGDFAHFGREFRHPSNETVGDWRESRSTGQMRNLVGLALLVPSFLARQFRCTRHLRFDASLDDHLPWHYISRSALLVAVFSPHARRVRRCRSGACGVAEVGVGGNAE